MLRPDLLGALNGLKPPFIRVARRIIASDYKWKDGIGPRESRVYHPNMIWGGYSTIMVSELMNSWNFAVN